MNCRSVQEQLGLYLDGELAEASREELEAHLDCCAGCAQELQSLQRVAASLAPDGTVTVPDGLWTAIEKRLGESATTPQPQQAPVLVRLFRRPIAAAASVVLLVGLGLVAFVWLGGIASEAEASSINFCVLLDELPLDARNAFRKFLTHYDAAEATPSEVQRYAPNLNFAIPDTLPGGFQLEQAYTLRFGETAGAAAAYSRDGEFVATIFHRPVRREQFGGHKDYSCVVGKHRGHKVTVGAWKLVHLTDPSTCHCVLSRLDEETELPPIMAAVSPAYVGPHDQ